MRILILPMEYIILGPFLYLLQQTLFPVLPIFVTGSQFHLSMQTLKGVSECIRHGKITFN